MGQPAYPTGSDIAAYLADFGVTVPVTASLEVFAVAGRQAFENAAGRVMLAGDPEARLYDPPAEPLLDLMADLAEITSVTYQPEGAPEAVFTYPADYRPMPQNAAAQGRPWQWLDFRRMWWIPRPDSLRGAISILGRWGYGLTIPEDAWLAMLAAGAAPLWDKAAAASLAAGGGGPLKSWREGNASEEYATVTADQTAALKTTFLANFPATVAAYRKDYL